jgi:gamma-glutamylcysteine synthetase
MSEDGVDYLTSTWVEALVEHQGVSREVGNALLRRWMLPVPAPLYDSTEDTLEHIDRVQNYLDQIVIELDQRTINHDASKLEDPEKAVFDRMTPKLRQTEYGSAEYHEHLAEMKVALDHHYATYRHHPEHFELGIREMNLIDLIEMLADWKASTERMADGDLERSIYQNAERFKYGDELEVLLMNTARDLGWIGA